jgi:putative transposase
VNEPVNAASVPRPLTLRLKVKAEAYPWLRVAAMECNTVWNFVNETAEKAITRTDKLRKWVSGFDLCNLTSGATECFERIGSDTIQRVCTEYAAKRNAVKRRRLAWRISKGTRRSLGWVPFKAASIKRKGAGVRFCGKAFRVFEAARLNDMKFRDGCFAEDACGDWWLCVPVTVAVDQTVAPKDAVGIDLGLKTIATTSDGQSLEAGRWTHAHAEKLAMAQRRGHKKQAKRIHRKAANQRKDALHKFSTMLVANYQRIYVGDVSSTKLVKTRMAKSVLDSGWGMLKNMLDYKSRQAARTFEVVDERYTSRTCSACGSLSGPRGVNGLRVRDWICADCGESHDRDVNSARLILFRGEVSPSGRGNESLQELRPPSRAPRPRKAGTGEVFAAA